MMIVVVLMKKMKLFKTETGMSIGDFCLKE